jgi:hypothetical protein
MTQTPTQTPTQSETSSPPFQRYSPVQTVSNRRVPAWILSLCLHTLLFGILLLAISQFPQGASEVENRTGGIVLVNQQSDATEYLDEGDVETSEEQSQQAADSPPPAAIQNDLPPDLPGLESQQSELTGAGESLAEMLSGSETMIDVPDRPNIGKVGGKVTTEVFGIKGTGSRFVYVFDRSKSMASFESRPMIAAKRELLKSLESLNKSNQFQIIFYNESTRIFNANDKLQLFLASDDMKKEATGFVNRTQPDGGTDHVRALKQAFQLNPDVIFLLTDAEGGFSNRELADLQRFRGTAVINAIQFGISDRRDRSLKRVSEMTGGNYLFKNIRTLRIKGD